MTIALNIQRIECGLSDKGISVKELCTIAGINQSTWTRWKSGATTPNMATWSKIESAFDDLTSDAKKAEAAE